jgi:hypothetical protein
VEESDSSETIEGCTGESKWWNESLAIFVECVDLIPSIGLVSFKFCLREANQVAHEIARFFFVTGSMKPLALIKLTRSTRNTFRS